MRKILFVCTGNICRSPAAELICRNKLEKLGISTQFELDSAAIQAHHTGETPDYRIFLEGEKRGLNFSQTHSRKIHLDDFFQFDLILGMTKHHVDFLQSHKPHDARVVISLFSNYVDKSYYDDIKDPYYGNMEDFSEMFDHIEDLAEKLILKITKS
jgi:protein-tyrosine phosphatase